MNGKNEKSFLIFKFIINYHIFKKVVYLLEIYLLAKKSHKFRLENFPSVKFFFSNVSSKGSRCLLASKPELSLQYNDFNETDFANFFGVSCEHESSSPDVPEDLEDVLLFFVGDDSTESK